MRNVEEGDRAGEKAVPAPTSRAWHHAAMQDDPLFAQCYDALRAAARRVARGVDVEPTSLLHEAWLRLPDDGRFNSRTHFIATATRALRYVIADRARRSQAARRGGGWTRMTLSGVGANAWLVDLVALDECMTALEAFDPRGAQVLTLRCFGGLTHAEIAEALDTSLSTVERDWRVTRAWVVQRLRAA